MVQSIGIPSADNARGLRNLLTGVCSSISRVLGLLQTEPIPPPQEEFRIGPEDLTTSLPNPLSRSRSSATLEGFRYGRRINHAFILHSLGTNISSTTPPTPAPTDHDPTPAPVMHAPQSHVARKSCKAILSSLLFLEEVVLFARRETNTGITYRWNDSSYLSTFAHFDMPFLAVFVIT